MGKTEHNIAILILAAGGSTRMGNTIKQLLPWKNTTLLGHAISEAKASNALEVMVVLGAHAHRIRKEINEEEVLTAIHVDWESGLGSSLAFGMRQLWNRNTPLEGVLVMLVDQPLINSDYINRMIALFH
ncbi:MAG: nucleotidyltransferase family protein, partial [Bacteroidota bacterium]